MDPSESMAAIAVVQHVSGSMLELTLKSSEPGSPAKHVDEANEAPTQSKERQIIHVDDSLEMSALSSLKMTLDGSVSSSESIFIATTEEGDLNQVG